MDNEIHITHVDAIPVHPDDVILWKFDSTINSLDQVKPFYDFLQNSVFPDNKVIAIDKGTNADLEVFHMEE